MKKILFAVLVLGVRVAANAQVTPAAPPDIGRLTYFLGSWNVETQTLPAQTPPDAPVRSVQEYAQLEGTAFVVLRSTKTSTREVQLAVMGFDPVKRVYSAEYFTAPSFRGSMAGIASGSMWTWMSRDGQLKQTLQVVSPTAFTFEVARAVRGAGWVPISAGKAVKIDHQIASPPSP